MTKDKVRSTEEALSTVRALKLALEALDDLSHYADLCELFLKETHPGKAESLRKRVTNSIKAITAIKEALAQTEHDKTDVRCECCGYMTYHREHLGCIRAAKLKEPEQDPLTDEDLELLKRALRFYEGCPDGQYDELVVELIHDRLARRSDIKPLTDEEIILIVADCASSHQHTDIHFARAIEAKLKEKNTHD